MEGRGCPTGPGGAAALNPRGADDGGGQPGTRGPATSTHLSMAARPHSSVPASAGAGPRHGNRGRASGRERRGRDAAAR